jgi:hypothetical protein
MSAYDNPTIIKDNSGTILAEGIASFGENFSKAMNAQLAIAAEERKYEAKLKKETNDRQIATQKANTEQSMSNMKETQAAVDTLKPADPVLTNKFGKLYSELLTKAGEGKVKGSLEVLSPEETAANDKFQKGTGEFKQKCLSSFGPMADNLITGKAMGPREWSNTTWNGTTKLQQKINEITYYASDDDNYSYRDKVNKDLYIEDEDPSKPVMEIITEVKRDKELVNFSDDELKAERERKDSGLIYDETTQKYSLKFKQNLGSSTWDGTFFHKIPDAPDPDKAWGKDQGNVLDEKTNGLRAEYVLNAGSPVLTKEKIKEFPNKERQVETVYLNMPAINGVLNQYYKAGATALLNSDLKDKVQLRSFLQNKLYRGNEDLAKWLTKFDTDVKQEDFIKDKLLEIDTETKLGKTYSRRIAKEEDVTAKRANKVGDWVYYSQSEKIVATAKAEQSGGGKDESTAADKAQAAFNTRVKTLIDSGGETGIIKDGLTLMKHPKDGWGLYDSDGNKKPGTENITNPRKLATFIGSTLPTLK